MNRPVVFVGSSKTSRKHTMNVYFALAVLISSFCGTLLETTRCFSINPVLLFPYTAISGYSDIRGVEG